MSNTVPNAKNWPEDDRTNKRIAVKRARLLPIAQGNSLDAEGQLIRITRRFQKEERGRLVGFVGAFMYRDKEGSVRVMNSAHGKIGLDQQMMLARKLERWIESDD